MCVVGVVEQAGEAAADGETEWEGRGTEDGSTKVRLRTLGGVG